MINVKWELAQAAQSGTDWGGVIVTVAVLALLGFICWLILR